MNDSSPPQELRSTRSDVAAGASPAVGGQRRRFEPTACEAQAATRLLRRTDRRTGNGLLSGRRRRRPAFATTVAIATAAVLSLIVVVLARYALSEMIAERTEALSTRAEQILLSARDWSRAHVEQLRSEGEVELPMDDLIRPSATGRLELRYRDAGDESPLIECHLTLREGRWRATRRVFWPVSPNNSPRSPQRSQRGDGKELREADAE